MQSVSATIWTTQFSARRDLRIQKNLEGQTAAYFNVLDPITRQSYRIGELERAVLSTLSTASTLMNALKSLKRIPQFASVSDSQLLITVERLQVCGLVRIAKHRLSRDKVTGAEGAVKAQTALSKFVVWQVRGLQPDAWLAKIAPRTNAIFSRGAVQWWLVAAFVTCCCVLLEFPRLASQSNSWQWILHPAQGTALFIVFIVTRALHELGHAIVCKRHGIRCPDIGLFVILGAPCVYCDVSESWQLPSRWQRASVAVAGMYVELIIATLAAWVWMVTIDGPANTVALQTMFVCSISTILINANPLMRFDGYYILSDMLDESNLRGRADAIAESWLQRLVLGRRASSRASAQVAMTMKRQKTLRTLLFLFSWAGWFYRAGLSLAIAGLLVAIYDAWHLAWVGRCIAVLILLSWWGVPSVKLAKSLIQTASKTNTRLRLAIASGLLLGCICLLPMPYRQFASGWVQPANLKGIFVSTGGTLAPVEPNEQVQPPKTPPQSDERVDKRKPIFQIHDVRTLLEKTRAEGLLARAQARVEANNRSHHDELSASKAALFNAEQMVKRIEGELDNLNLKSPESGRLMMMPAAATTGPWSESTDLVSYRWNSSTQLGRYIPSGTMLAAVCDDQFMAIIPLNDKQLEWIAAGTEVRVRCLNRPNEVHTCNVLDIVNLSDAAPAMRLLHRDLSQAAPDLPSVDSNKSVANAAARIRLPPEVRFISGSRIDGVFVAPPKTIATLAARWLKQNLRWLSD